MNEWLMLLYQSQLWSPSFSPPSKQDVLRCYYRVNFGPPKIHMLKYIPQYFGRWLYLKVGSLGGDCVKGGCYGMSWASQVALVVKIHLPMQGDARDTDSIPELGRSSGVWNGILTPVFLPVNFHGQRSLVGYSPWSCKESETAEHRQTRCVLI